MNTFVEWILSRA